MPYRPPPHINFDQGEFATGIPMLLLHISDIHFREPDCLDPNSDPDRPYRTRMMNDVRKRVQELGPVGAIMLGGDTAFKGHPEEFRFAHEWIQELASATGCHMSRVFVVPGNHDVDRRAVEDKASVRNAQSAISRASDSERERELRAQLRDLDSGRALFAPLAAYNDFAARFACQVYPGHLTWQQDLALDGGVRLRIHGLTSTLLSNANDRRGSLYLSPLQTVFDPVDNVVNLAMCHHPADWFMDYEDVDDAFCGRASIHLFGHRHRQRFLTDFGFVRFSAGALNPDRSEAGWDPAYNLIHLNVEGSGSARKLRVDAHLLKWQVNPEMYVPKSNPQGGTVFTHYIPVPEGAAAVVSSIVEHSGQPEATTHCVPRTDADVEAAMGDDNTRNLIFRFWKLTASQRREIATKLELISDEELLLSEPERYGRALLRAGERNLIHELAQEVSERER